MWPAGRRLDRESQTALRDWIDSPEFVREAEALPERVSWYTHALSLSALSDDRDSASGSSCGSETASASSAASERSISNMGSADSASEEASADWSASLMGPVPP